MQFVFAGLNAWLYEHQPVSAEILVQAHISLGAVILILTLVRVAIRPFSYRAPRRNQVWSTTIKAVHLLLYGCLILLPMSGYVRLAALGFPIKLFGAVPVPPLAPKPELALHAAMAHDVIAITLIGATLIHVGGALLHHRLIGERVFRRMGFGIRS